MVVVVVALLVSDKTVVVLGVVVRLVIAVDSVFDVDERTLLDVADKWAVDFVINCVARVVFGGISSDQPNKAGGKC